MVDSIYHMTLKLIKKSHFWRENVKILPSLTQLYNMYNGRHNSGLSILLHSVISLPDATSQATA